MLKCKNVQVTIKIFFGLKLIKKFKSQNVQTLCQKCSKFTLEMFKFYEEKLFDNLRLDLFMKAEKNYVCMKRANLKLPN
jgi:hypothetical protein